MEAAAQVELEADAWDKLTGSEGEACYYQRHPVCRMEWNDRSDAIALENFRDELAETGRFFRQLADAAVRDDSAGLETAICEFGEHQREQVLSILREEVSA